MGSVHAVSLGVPRFAIGRGCNIVLNFGIILTLRGSMAVSIKVLKGDLMLERETTTYPAEPWPFLDASRASLSFLLCSLAFSRLMRSDSSFWRRASILRARLFFSSSSCFLLAAKRASSRSLCLKARREDLFLWIRASSSSRFCWSS